MDKEEVSLLREICNARGEDLSDFVRRSIKLELARLGYASSEKAKALGIKRGTTR